jgi:hypothetical protein
MELKETGSKVQGKRLLAVIAIVVTLVLGTVGLRVIATDRLRPVREQPTTQAASDQPVPIRASRFAVIKGRVLDGETGGPIATAQVHLRDEAGVVHVSPVDETGRFVWSFPGGHVAVMAVAAAGYHSLPDVSEASPLVSVVVGPGEVTTLRDFHLEPEHLCDGEVVTQDGGPAVSAALFVWGRAVGQTGEPAWCFVSPVSIESSFHRG